MSIFFQKICVWFFHVNKYISTLSLSLNKYYSTICYIIYLSILYFLKIKDIINQSWACVRTLYMKDGKGIDKDILKIKEKYHRIHSLRLVYMEDAFMWSSDTSFFKVTGSLFCGWCKCHREGVWSHNWPSIHIFLPYSFVS